MGIKNYCSACSILIHVMGMTYVGEVHKHSILLMKYAMIWICNDLCNNLFNDLCNDPWNMQW